MLMRGALLTLAIVVHVLFASGCSGSGQLFSGFAPPDGASPVAATPDAGWFTPPMSLVSLGVPAFASGVAAPGSASPAKANDGNPSTTWISDTLPAWLAYDVSALPATQRKDVVVAWYAVHCASYIYPVPDASLHMPFDYTIEVNNAPGGGSPPSSDWTQVVSVTGNVRSSRQHLVSLDGGNWIRMSISNGTGPNVSIDLDVHSAPSGISDSWLFMGDSITFQAVVRASSDLPALVHALKPIYYPAIINAATGGASTLSATQVIDQTMAGFPGRFVVLAYGTNDQPARFRMEPLVEKVIAAGKIPVIPHMPWSDQRLFDGPQINAAIDALYLKYPEIVVGPDLWQTFLNRADLFPPGNVHPNAAGQEVLRRAWAQAMMKVYE